MAADFHHEVEVELANSDTLVVLARGLGMATCLARFVATRATPGRLIVAVNIPRQIAVEVIWPAVLSAVGQARPVDPGLLLPRFISADYSIRDRASVYGIGGFVIVTASVLVNDLLLRNMPVDIVDGIFVFAADKVRPSSNIHFALTLFRLQNKTAFIKAISENATGLSSGFHNVEKIMRTLYTSRLSLWPRFHKTVKGSLARRTPDVLDLSVSVSSSQGAVIASLRELAIRILDDLRLASRSLDLSDVIQKPEIGQARTARLSTNFDELVRRQLVSSAGERQFPGGDKARRLLSDLCAIRSLLSEAVDLNCVLFYQHLITMRHTQGRTSYWMMRQEAQHMLSLARSRVWVKKKVISSSNRAVKVPADKSSKRRRLLNGSCAASEIDHVVTAPILDPSPKWRALKAVLEEIELDVAQVGPLSDVGRVLVLVRDQSQLDELRQVFTIGPEQYMLQLFRNVLPTVYQQIPPDMLAAHGSAAIPSRLQPHQKSNHDPATNTPAETSDVLPGDEKDGPLERSDVPLESSRVAHRQVTLTQLASDGKSRDQSGNVNGSVPETETRMRNREWQREGAGRSRSSSARRIGLRAATTSNRNVSRRRVEQPDSVYWPWPVRVPPKGIEDCLPGLKSYFGREGPENKLKQVEVLLWCADWIDAQGRGLRLLHEYKPSFIVMYNADLAFMRQVEVFRSASPGRPVRLYLLAYDDSIDEDRYRNVVEKERFAFKSLIRERATMVVHTGQDGRMAKVEDPLSAIAPSRVARRGLGADRDSRLTDAETMKNGSTIVVDTRELRSALPMMLFEAGITIVPVTLEVGDFVLSKHVAVERKSVPDLYGSFSSGRLFNQAEALCRHYREACLMIEFESDDRLSLASTSGGIPPELVPSSIISKIVLLLHQFPSLHLIWCKGPQDTAELFATLKLSEEEPDVAAATSMGVDCAESIDATYNSGPAALLRSLPGIDGNNINSVMRNVKNVSALFTMSVAELTDILGSSSKAQLLYDFVNEEPCEALAAL